MQAIKRLIPHLFTAGNLVFGIFAIVFTLTGKIEWAPYCILVSAFLDFFDGFVARLLDVSSELGKQLDSLADMVTFGVAPGIIVFQLFHLEMFPPENLIDTSSEISSWLPYFAFLIPVFAMFRLAKFNLDNRQTDHFIGLPTPAMTLFFASIPLVMQNIDSIGGKAFLLLLLHPVTLFVLTLVFSILMVAPLPLFALKFKSFGWKGNEISYIFLTISAVLLATLFWWALPLIIILYLLLSVVQLIFKRNFEKQ